MQILFFHLPSPLLLLPDGIFDLMIFMCLIVFALLPHACHSSGTVPHNALYMAGLQVFPIKDPIM